jgi:hypothetical protein
MKIGVKEASEALAGWLGRLDRRDTRVADCFLVIYLKPGDRVNLISFGLVFVGSEAFEAVRAKRWVQWLLTSKARKRQGIHWMDLRPQDPRPTMKRVSTVVVTVCEGTTGAKATKPG